MCDPAPCGERVNSFALVSYIPDPLAEFLDRLRIDLEVKIPECKAPPRAHVTVLPPRGLAPGVTSREAWAFLEREIPRFVPMSITPGEIEIFPGSHVVYLAVQAGFEDLIEMHTDLNQGPVLSPEKFPFHPHITLAQTHTTRAEAERILADATKRWERYRGPRSFVAETFTFVQNTENNFWQDLQEFSPVSAA